MEEGNELLAAKEVAELLGITEFAVRQLARRGDLLWRNVGGRKSFRKKDIETYLERVRIFSVGRPGKP